jgi:Rrf2 family nitric oxide-sensitive transcriptional repressor
MPTLLRISDAASLGLHALLYMADHPDRLVSAHEIAAHDRVSEAHLAKVLQRLVKVGLVRSARGPRGGFVLGRPANRITLMNIYEAIEGPVSETAGCCLFGTPVCARGQCLFGGLIQNVSRQFREHLLKTRLSEFAKGANLTHVSA